MRKSPSAPVSSEFLIMNGCEILSKTQCINWGEHVIFVFASINLTYYIYWFGFVKSFSVSLDYANLVMIFLMMSHEVGIFWSWLIGVLHTSLICILNIFSILRMSSVIILPKWFIMPFVLITLFIYFLFLLLSVCINQMFSFFSILSVDDPGISSR